ncbi:hypothetical protein B9G53_20870 [Pseudanabaena sp. SR411]|nr:hypothetical protein B9G53_20870 [Pseudanabaena sp. SR411]
MSIKLKKKPRNNCEASSLIFVRFCDFHCACGTMKVAIWVLVVTIAIIKFANIFEILSKGK